MPSFKENAMHPLPHKVSKNKTKTAKNVGKTHAVKTVPRSPGRAEMLNTGGMMAGFSGGEGDPVNGKPRTKKKKFPGFPKADIDYNK